MHAGAETMAQDTLSTFILTSEEGQITIPDHMLAALGITEPTVVIIAVVDGKLVIEKLDDPPEGSVREYSDEEIAEFLEEDRIPDELAQWVRERYPSRLSWLSDPDGSGIP